MGLFKVSYCPICYRWSIQIEEEFVCEYHPDSEYLTIDFPVDNTLDIFIENHNQFLRQRKLERICGENS